MSICAFSSTSKRESGPNCDQVDFIERQSKGQYGPSATLFGHQDPSGVSELSQKSKQSISLTRPSQLELSAQTGERLRAAKRSRVP